MQPQVLESRALSLPVAQIVIGADEALEPIVPLAPLDPATWISSSGLYRADRWDASPKFSSQQLFLRLLTFQPRERLRSPVTRRGCSRLAVAAARLSTAPHPPHLQRPAVEPCVSTAGAKLA